MPENAAEAYPAVKQEQCGSLGVIVFWKFMGFIIGDKLWFVLVARSLLRDENFFGKFYMVFVLFFFNYLLSVID